MESLNLIGRVIGVFYSSPSAWPMACGDKLLHDSIAEVLQMALRA